MNERAKPKTAFTNPDMARSAATKAAATMACVAILATFLSATADPAEARARRHLHHDDVSFSYGLDPVCGSLPSPVPLLYPEADWRPFFHRVRHFGPVLYQPIACAVAPVATELSPPISTLD